MFNRTISNQPGLNAILLRGNEDTNTVTPAPWAHSHVTHTPAITKSINALDNKPKLDLQEENLLSQAVSTKKRKTKSKRRTQKRKIRRTARKRIVKRKKTSKRRSKRTTRKRVAKKSRRRRKTKK